MISGTRILTTVHADYRCELRRALVQDDETNGAPAPQAPVAVPQPADAAAAAAAAAAATGLRPRCTLSICPQRTLVPAAVRWAGFTLRTSRNKFVLHGWVHVA